MNSVELTKFSNLVCDFSITDDNTILLVSVKGKYGYGSKGNLDGLYIFSQLVAHYFIFEPISIIIDLNNLDYQWGNTILKSLNIFVEIGRDDSEREKISIIVLSDDNYAPIYNLLSNITDGNRFLCKSIEEALVAAKKNVNYYLSE